jgi:hypothetical protein
MDDNNWLWITALCCVIPFILIVIASVYVVRHGQRLVTPEIDDLQRSYDKLKASNPTLSTEQLVQKIIRRQALRAGIIGALTSVGGIFALPFGLAIDLYTTSRLQAATLYFISQAFSAEGRVPLLNMNQALALRAEDRVREFLAGAGSAGAQRVYRRMMVILVEKTFAKLIPGIGLIIGFIVNYVIARGVSQLAAAYYSGHLLNSPQPIGEIAQQAEAQNTPPS